MTPPPPTTRRTAQGGRVAVENAAAEVQGPLVRQPAPAARLARILHHSASDLWDICTLTDSDQMSQEARAVACRILAASGATNHNP
jgi:hypothetical protein